MNTKRSNMHTKRLLLSLTILVALSSFDLVECEFPKRIMLHPVSFRYAVCIDENTSVRDAYAFRPLLFLLMLTSFCFGLDYQSS